MGFQQVLFTGEKGKSFSETGAGYGAELTIMRDGDLFTPYLKARTLTASGQQDFLDGTSTVSSKFLFYQGQSDLGVYLYPIRRRRNGFNVYVGAAGSFSYNHISLNQSTTLSAIPHADHGLGGGYTASLGGEWILSSRNAEKWSFALDVSYRYEQTSLLKQTVFDLGSTAICLGLGW